MKSNCIFISGYRKNKSRKLECYAFYDGSGLVELYREADEADGILTLNLITFMHQIWIRSSKRSKHKVVFLAGIRDAGISKGDEFVI